MHPAVNEHIPVLNGLKHRPSKGGTFSRENEGIHEFSVSFFSIEQSLKMNCSWDEENDRYLMLSAWILNEDRLNQHYTRIF
jgi:hypothetical protein